MRKAILSGKNKLGFTLVELMIVVTIIVVLVGIVIVGASAAKTVARDNQRKADIKLIQLKLESYFSENNSYPKVWETFVSVADIPKDPGTGEDYTYIPLKLSLSSSCGADSAPLYVVYATLENQNSEHVSFDSAIRACDGTNPLPEDKTYIFDVTSPSYIKK